jgi:Flp pilus assembly protein TadG
MNNKFQEKGQALIIIALAALVLFGFSALAIDGARVFEDRRHAQNAADTSAFAAALAKIRGQNFATAAQNRAASNGYNNDADSTVTVNLCSEVGITCDGLPAGANPSEYIKVTVTSILPTTFARVLGWNHVTNVAVAITRVQGETVTGHFGGAALVSLKPTDTAFSGNGNFSVDVNGSGIFSNSNSNCSAQFSGNGTIEVDTSITIASGGTQCENGNLTIPVPVAGSQVPYPPANLNVPAPSIDCSLLGVGSVSGNTYSPGNYNAINVNTNGDIIFTPGNYCFNGSVTINGNTNVIANEVNFRINSGNFSINGNSTFTCSNMLVYSQGGTGMSFNGNGSNTCVGVTFYMATGSVTWNGNVGNTFKAPTSGIYQGLLIYLPYGNTSSMSINGNSGNQLTGSIIAVSSPITITGNSGSSGLHTQIIGYTISMAGNSNTTINYDAAEQYNPPANPTIELTK